MRGNARGADLTPSNIDDVLHGCDLILDGTDNFETRYLLNDFSLMHSIPWIYGAAVGSYGLTMPIMPGESACLACVYPEPPSDAQPTCETMGVLNPITSIIASLQCAAATRILAGLNAILQITTVDVWSGQSGKWQCRPDPIAGHADVGSSPGLPPAARLSESVRAHDRSTRAHE
ncbi:MAG: ThiF family adenylyltransferase [Bryobacteraceae bacterium]